MPNIELVSVIQYQPLDSYNHIVDNRPIIGLSTQISLVNAQVDINTQILSDSIGTQGTLANRLNQSINQDGTLKVTAINNALHNIADHLDDSTYVRMLATERAKLSFIADNATSFELDVHTVSTIRMFSNDTVTLQPSDTVIWRVCGNDVYADANFPTTAIHTHYYGLVPESQDMVFPDYQDYQTPDATPYIEGSLRVYVNGIRLNNVDVVYVPVGNPGVITWMTLSYTEDTATSGVVTSGQFSLSQAIPSSASIIIDFDVLV